MDRYNAYRDRGDLKAARTSKSTGKTHYQHGDGSELLRKPKPDSNLKEKAPHKESNRRKHRAFAEGGDYGYNKDYNKLDIDRWKRQINDLESESDSDQYQSDANESRAVFTNVPPAEFIQVKPKLQVKGEQRVTSKRKENRKTGVENGGSGDGIQRIENESNEEDQLQSNILWHINSQSLKTKNKDDRMQHASQYDIISKSEPIIAKGQDSLEMYPKKVEETYDSNEEEEGKSARSRGSSKVGPRKSGESPDGNLVSEEDEDEENPESLFEVFKVEEPKLGIVTIDEESYSKFYEVIIDDKGRKKNRLLHEVILNNLPEFVKHPVYPGFKLKCILTRNRGGLGGKVYPSFELKLETGLGGKISLLVARKRKKAKTSYYLIAMDYVDLYRRSDSCVGKVRSNLFGTQFTIYDFGVSPKKYGFDGSLAKGIWDFREELGVVVYEKNVLGLCGPRKMKIIIPRMINKCQRYPHFPESDSDEGLQSQLGSSTIELKNKNPVWNSQSNSYVLNFFGRVTEASVKNFQIVKDEASSESIYMQFGRTDTNTFSLDIGFPFCPLQAFGIALSSLDYKIGCE